MRTLTIAAMVDFIFDLLFGQPSPLELVFEEAVGKEIQRIIRYSDQSSPPRA